MSRDKASVGEIEQAEWDIRMRAPQYRLAMLALLSMGAQWRREEALREHYERVKRLKAEGGYETWLKAKMERNKRYPRKPRPPAPPKPKKVTVAERLKTEPEFAFAYHARKRAMKKERLKQLRHTDPEEWAAKVESTKQKDKLYRQENREQLNVKANERYHGRMSDPEVGQVHREKHRTKVNKARKKLAASGHLTRYMREKRATDTNFRIADNLRRRINNALRGNCKSAHTLELLGCTIPDLVVHLEKQFEPGMTWANYGVGRGFWSIDHIKPCASFDLSKESEQWACFVWTNLKPMWFEENCGKGCRMDSPCPPPPSA